ncbi:hypothetical protein [Xanthocytophaga flava]|uniref:hypothetical protein n=1 Tax=Xanthocytophaga flava TaxID=3048013 RepID=UPI0028D0AE30|nr:hypothetical protein [Xanthocytophaga flavus]MDJ1472785.1 hypothetical protein [Xanthocytophaga flavus]
MLYTVLQYFPLLSYHASLLTGYYNHQAEISKIPEAENQPEDGEHLTENSPAIG